MHHIILALAQAATGGGGAPAGGAGASAPAGGCAGQGGLSSFIPLILMFVIFYFMLIRPQQKKAKDHASFLSNLKKGDQVVTRGGVIGRITGVTDTMLTLEIQEKVRIRVLKSYVDGQHKDGSTAAPDKSDKNEKKDKEPTTTATS